MARKVKFDNTQYGYNKGGVKTDNVSRGSVKAGKRRIVVKTESGVSTTDFNNQKTAYKGRKTKTVYKDGEIKRRKETDFAYDNGTPVMKTIKKFKNAL